MNAPFPQTRKSQTSDYDYSADSDLEDDEEDDELDVASLGDTRQAAPHHAVPLPVVVTDDPEAPSSSVGTLTVFTEEKPNQSQVKADEDTLEVQYNGARALCSSCRR